MKQEIDLYLATVKYGPTVNSGSSLQQFNLSSEKTTRKLITLGIACIGWLAAASPLQAVVGPLTGTLNGNLDGRESVFDGDIGTFPDTSNGNWAGQDLGSGAFKSVTLIRFHPRTDQLDRMVGSKFQGSHTPDFSSGVVTLHVVTSTPPSGWTEVPISNPMAFQYLRIIMSTNAYGNVNEVQFIGDDATPDITTPAAPTALSATVVSGTQINLSWTDNSNNEDLFLIERRIGSGIWAEITAITADTTTYGSTGLLPGTLYQHRVRAFNNFGEAYESFYTNVASATTTGNAPLTGSIIGDINNRDLLFDNDTSTFTDDDNHFIAGLFFEGGVKKVTSLRFAPRPNQLNRMIGGKFQGSTTEDFSSGVVTIYTIPSQPTDGFNTVPTASLLFNNVGFRAVRYVAPAEGYANVAEIEFYGADYGAPINMNPPLAPSSVIATAISDYQIDLNWTDNSSNEAFFSIERQLSPSGQWVEIAVLASGTTNYTGAAALEIGTSYGFRIRAYNDAAANGGFSPFSTVVIATTTGRPQSSGTPIGTFQDITSINVDKAFDGDTSTFFESGEEGAWVGLDLGGLTKINRIRFSPRILWNGRMNGGVFQGSNTPDFSSGVVTLYTVLGNPPNGFSDVTVVINQTFRYVRFLALNGQVGGNPAELQFYGTSLGDPFLIPGGALVIAGNQATVTIPASTAGFSYSLFYSDTLKGNSWLPVMGNPKAGGGVLIWTNNITGAPRRFYRLGAE